MTTAATVSNMTVVQVQTVQASAKAETLAYSCWCGTDWCRGDGLGAASSSGFHLLSQSPKTTLDGFFKTFLLLKRRKEEQQHWEYQNTGTHAAREAK